MGVYNNYQRAASPAQPPTARSSQTTRTCDTSRHPPPHTHTHTYMCPSLLQHSQGYCYCLSAMLLLLPQLPGHSAPCCPQSLLLPGQDQPRPSFHRHAFEISNRGSRLGGSVPGQGSSRGPTPRVGGVRETLNPRYEARKRGQEKTWATWVGGWMRWPGWAAEHPAAPSPRKACHRC